jgi:hypothetical protein
LSSVLADCIVDLIATHTQTEQRRFNFAPDVCRNADILFNLQCDQAGPPHQTLVSVSPVSDAATPIGLRRIPPERAFIRPILQWIIPADGAAGDCNCLARAFKDSGRYFFSKARMMNGIHPAVHGHNGHPSLPPGGDRER